MSEILLTILWIILLGAGIKFIPFFRDIKGLPVKIILWLFLLRVISGQILTAIYTHYYDPSTADIHRFFNDSLVLYSALFKNPPDFLRMLSGIGSSADHLSVYYESMTDWYRSWISPVYNDNRILIRFNALLNVFSLGHLKVNIVIANFIALAGFVALYKFFIRYIHENKTKLLVVGIFLFPSVLFWSSGTIKEILMFPVLGFLILHTDSLLEKKGNKISNISIMIFTTGLFLMLKAYIFFLILPCYIAFRLSLRKTGVKKTLVFPAVILAYLFLILVFGHIFPQFNLVNLVVSKHNEFLLFSLSVNVGSLIHEVYLEPTLAGIASYMPRGFFNTAVFPHVFQELSAVMWIAAIENILVLLIITLIIFYSIRRKNISSIAWMGIWITLLIFTFVGTITPVSGSLVRYRIPSLPFLWVSMVSIIPFTFPEQFSNKTLRYRTFIKKKPEQKKST